MGVDHYLCEAIDSVAEKCRNYFQFNAFSSELLSAVTGLRRIVYESGSDRELLFADAITAIISRKILNSSIRCLPLYTDVPIDRWQNALSKPGFIREFWPAQKLLGENGVLSGTSAVVQMPTSSGKTKSTELIIRSSFLSGRAEVAVVVAPFRALCREITTSFKSAFKDERVNVNELQDVMDVSFDDQVILRSILGDQGQEERVTKSIIVTTPEKLVYLMRHEDELAENIGLLIFDEGHQFDTGRRGVTYELLMASLKSSIGDGVQKVLISD